MRLLITTTFVAMAITVAAQEPTLRTTIPGVLLDVNVVDDHGAPVTDLTAKDFEVFEDGKRQTLRSVALVQSQVPGQGVKHALAEANATQNKSVAAGHDDVASSTAEAPAASTQPESPQEPTVTAIVFDRLSPESRDLSFKAATAFVETLGTGSDYAGVFLADVSLRVLQPFTNNRRALHDSVRKLLEIAPTNTTQSEMMSPHARQLDMATPPTAGAEFAAGGPTNAYDLIRRLGSDSVEQMLAEMELRMERSYQRLLDELNGQASVAALRAIVDSMARLPGRKSILYFAEGLTLTSRVRPLFESVIGYANRANVTVYTVDASGLRVHSKELETSRELSVAGAQGVGDITSGGQMTRGDGPWTRALERQDQLLSSRPGAVLGRLANETGGFLVENTNDLGAGVARMRQDRTLYYLLGYEPTNPSLDDKFRKVHVKVKRKGVTVRARAGYLATGLQDQQ
jgi:VWFA-related protein